MIRVHITDDHRIFRDGLKRLLNDSEDMEVVAETGSAQDLLDSLETTGCDVIVLDISLPGRSGLDALKQVKAQYPKLPVLMLSMHPEDQYALRAIKAGASGYLTKDAAADELVAAIRKVQGGGKYFSESLAERLFSELSNPIGAEPHTLLSDRELQVLCMIGSGLSVSGIAERLSLSVKTISTHRTRILLKMGMKNNAELTSYVVRNGLSDGISRR
ncbi:MAG TPA: response regulator transcription factor [Geomonas sp.]|nr:response regulator transcription factor [Geomonas sp.]